MDNNDQLDTDFNSGFASDDQTPTTTPETTVAAPEAVAAPTAPAAAQPEIKYAQITQQDYDNLLAKATAIDEIKAENKSKFDSVFGQMGGMKQLVERLQSSTKAGQKVEVSSADFEELVAEGYGDLAEMQAGAFNRILAKLQLQGTADETKPISQDQVGEIFQQRFTPEREAIKQELREEFAHAALSNAHEGWEKVVATPDFQAWMKSSKTDQLKDRSGALFAESIDANFVSKQLTAYQASRKQSTTKQSRIEDAITPRGTGGHGLPDTGEDEFSKGFSGSR